MSPPGSLLSDLLDTRERLEALIIELSEEGKIGRHTVTEEEQLRRARRALRQINYEHLPWVRVGRIDTERAARITLWLFVIWQRLPLTKYPGRG